MVALVPTLSLKGWLEDPHEKASQLMGWFMMAQATQSRTFYGNIASMSDLVVRFGKSPGALCDEIKLQLESLFRSYFDEAEATVINLPLDGEDDANGRYQVKITLTAYTEGRRINLLEAIDVGNSTFNRVKAAINGS